MGRDYSRLEAVYEVREGGGEEGARRQCGSKPLTSGYNHEIKTNTQTMHTA
jgi:hypothetical protein